MEWGTVDVERGRAMGNVRSEIERANAGFSEAFGRGDAAAVAGVYAKGAMLLPPNSGLVEGAGSIQGFWQAVMTMGIRSVRLETMEVEAHGDTAVEVGRYELLAAGGQQADFGKYLVVWKSDQGGWKLYRDIWNSSKPAQ